MDLVFSLPICNHWKGKNQCTQAQSNSVKILTLYFIFIYDTHYSKVLKDCCIKEKAENFFNKKSISKHFIHDTSQALYS